jgi:hypothetical protein
MRHQRAQHVRIGPFGESRRQAERGRMALGIGAAEKALRAHVEQPPRQAVAVPGKAVLLTHDEAFGAHRNQAAQAVQRAIGRDAIDGNVCQPAPWVAQGILNGSAGTDAHDIVAERRHGARHRRLAYSKFFNELARRHWTLRKAQAKATGMIRHGLNGKLNRKKNSIARIDRRRIRSRPGRK